MAGQTHQVDIGDDDLLPPWGTLLDVAHATDPATWALVGGLMVQLHARRAGIPPPRPTKDVDLLVDITANNATIASFAAALRGIGFTAIVPPNAKSPLHRFERGKEQIDVVVADHLPPKFKRPRLQMRPAFEAPGGEQALRRRDRFAITSTTASVTVFAPDVLGALVSKGAAHLVDQRDRDRHIEDAAVLLASVGSVGSLELSVLSKNDRKRLTHLVDELADDTARAWSLLDDSNRRTGQLTRDRLVLALHN